MTALEHVILGDAEKHVTFVKIKAVLLSSDAASAGNLVVGGAADRSLPVRVCNGCPRPGRRGARARRRAAAGQSARGLASRTPVTGCSN